MFEMKDDIIYYINSIHIFISIYYIHIYVKTYMIIYLNM